MDPAFAKSFKEETWALYAVGLLAAALRSTARIKRLGIRGLQIDDYLIFLAVGFYTLLCVSLNQVVSGGGSNLMSEEEIRELTPESHAERTRGSKWVFVSEHAMILTIWTLKAVMLLLYARITTGVTQRRLVNYCAIYVAAGFVASELSLFLICRPLHWYWAVPTPNPQCSSYQHYEIIQGIFAITADIFMLLIAIPLIMTVRLPTRQKAILVFLFGLGIFVIVAAILTKIYCLVPELISYAYMQWYFRESTVAMLVTCIPLMWTLFREIFPSWMSRTGASLEITLPRYKLSKQKSTRPTTTYQTADFDPRLFDKRSANRSDPGGEDLDLQLGGTTMISAGRSPGASQESVASLPPQESRGRPLKIRRDVTITVTADPNPGHDSDCSSSQEMGEMRC